MCHCILLFNVFNIQILLRGDWKEASATEFNSNFHELNLLRSEDYSKFESWIKDKKWKLASPEIQNEIVEV